MDQELTEYIEELLAIHGQVLHMKNVAALRLILDKNLEQKAKEIGISKSELDDFLDILKK
jgi:hypothetical protein